MNLILFIIVGFGLLILALIFAGITTKKIRQIKNEVNDPPIGTLMYIRDPYDGEISMFLELDNEESTSKILAMTGQEIKLRVKRKDPKDKNFAKMTGTIMTH